MPDEEMQNFSQKHSEWWSNRTLDEYELQGKILEYEEKYFEDMTFQPDSALYNTVQTVIDMYDYFSLELRSQYFTFHIEDLENGIMGQTNFPERKIVIAPKYKNDKSVILHEMIHAYELTLQTEHSVLNELLLITLYNKLKPQIPELDKLISEHVELYGQHCVSISGGTHGLLFYLKSLDLDLRCEYKLGTVCGYGRDTGEMWYY